MNNVINSLLGDDVGQYCQKLSSLGERVTDNKTPLSGPLKEDDSDSDESQTDESCNVCKLTSWSPNSLALKEITRCKGLLKISGSDNFLRNNSITSTNLEDYLRPSIWCWHPERLLPSDSKPLVCWDISCAGHQGIIKYIIESKKSVDNSLFITITSQLRRNVQFLSKILVTVVWKTLRPTAS